MLLLALSASVSEPLVSTWYWFIWTLFRLFRLPKYDMLEECRRLQEDLAVLYEQSDRSFEVWQVLGYYSNCVTIRRNKSLIHLSGCFELNELIEDVITLSLEILRLDLMMS
jgi:hypothetical protein